MFTRIRQVRFTALASLTIGATVASFCEGTFAQSDADAKAVALLKFARGCDNGPNVSITNARWGTKGEGLKFSGDCETMAVLKPLKNLDFGKEDFTVYVEVELDEDPGSGIWTIIEAKDKDGNGGFSLELTRLDSGNFRWQFELSNNGTVSYEGEAPNMVGRTELWVVREESKVSIFTKDGKKNGSVPMPNSLADSGTLQLRLGGDRAHKHCFRGTLFAAGVWRTALDMKEMALLDSIPWIPPDDG